MDGPRWLDLNADETAEDAVLPVEIRVKQGMALLDEKHGPEWVWRIDLDTLELSSPCRCVLAQVEGSFTGGAIRLGIGGLPTVSHGFAIDVESGYDSETEWPALNAEWKAQITRRRLELANA